MRCLFLLEVTHCARDGFTDQEYMYFILFLRYDLKKHGRSHSSERPYECSECGKRFKSQYARRIHEQAHSGLLYECDVCRRPYRYKALMRMHMKRTHPEVLVENEDTVPASSA